MSLSSETFSRSLVTMAWRRRRLNWPFLAFTVYRHRRLVAASVRSHRSSCLFVVVVVVPTCWWCSECFPSPRRRHLGPGGGRLSFGRRARDQDRKWGAELPRYARRASLSSPLAGVKTLQSPCDARRISR